MPSSDENTSGRARDAVVVAALDAVVHGSDPDVSNVDSPGLDPVIVSDTQPGKLFTLFAFHTSDVGLFNAEVRPDVNRVDIC